jgi:hypothetical protein
MAVDRSSYFAGIPSACVATTDSLLVGHIRKGDFSRGFSKKCSSKKAIER